MFGFVVAFALAKLCGVTATKAVLNIAFTAGGITGMLGFVCIDVYKRQLVKTFKKMKDYILENRDIIGQREILQLSRESANNRDVYKRQSQRAADGGIAVWMDLLNGLSRVIRSV